jgi:hypothetical protein
MARHPYQELVRVLFHLNEGYTKVSVERSEGQGMADGGFQWNIPTEVIPRHLRSIGSRFILVGEHIHPDARDTVEDLRMAMRAISVREIEASIP